MIHYILTHIVLPNVGYLRGREIVSHDYIAVSETILKDEMDEVNIGILFMNDSTIYIKRDLKEMKQIDRKNLKSITKTIAVLKKKLIFSNRRDYRKCI